jgi:ribosome-binding factor A
MLSHPIPIIGSMNEQRLLKINELIKRELGGILLREFDRRSDEIITITEVETTEDLLTAVVKVTIWPEGKRNAVFLRLGYAVGFFQSLLNRKLKMHPVPKIIFKLDTRVSEADRVEELIEKVKNEE